MRPLSGSANWLKSMDMAPGADMHVERPAKMLTLSPDHYSHSTVGRTYAISRRTLATDITLTVLASLRVGPLRGRLGFAGERQLLAVSTRCNDGYRAPLEVQFATPCCRRYNRSALSP